MYICFLFSWILLKWEKYILVCLKLNFSFDVEIFIKLFVIFNFDKVSFGVVWEVIIICWWFFKWLRVLFKIFNVDGFVIMLKLLRKR